MMTNKEIYERTKLNVIAFDSDGIHTDVINGSGPNTTPNGTMVLGGTWTPPGALRGYRDP